MKKIIAIFPLALLTACQAPVSLEDTAQDQCGAGSRQHLVGTQASNLDPSALPEFSRVIAPGTMVTRDYRPMRLNIYVGNSGQIERVDCG
ncbi:hypothetical protein H0484_04185 [Pusillimonas sp. CC-YST705]|uniref:Peptidase inhibitor I78 family protein n=1 Tax=Mesopusillimonas faecipullorum TaxID=2755040 RepID=A0ABS8CA96_9BURK|nr:I78 family peptidase inhibitor [Mesopusillimonas faecipullorum]MCB5362955.1 hypothetical protein [Mesopusillimonas faecipullorum]